MAAGVAGLYGRANLQRGGKEGGESNEVEERLGTKGVRLDELGREPRSGGPLWPAKPGRESGEWRNEVGTLGGG